MPKNQEAYTDEFREQIARLAMSGRSIAQIVRDYGVSKPSIRSWVNKYQKTGSFRDSDNRSAEETELIELRKKVKHLEMEVDILKQAALIMAKR